MKKFGLFFLCFPLIFVRISTALDSNEAAPATSPTALASPEASPPNLKAEMIGAFEAFKELQNYMISEPRFEAIENQTKISGLLGEINSKFHHVEMVKGPLAKEPGFASNLKIFIEMLDDVEKRFEEGRKSYALWRLRTASSYCIACHTRHEVSKSFFSSEPLPKDIDDLSKAEFYLATRQFDKARLAFYDSAIKTNDTTSMYALRKWLIIYTRVQPNPTVAIEKLTRVYSKINLSEYDRQQIVEWMAALRRWAKETKSDIPSIVKAENLIRQGLGMHDPVTGRLGTVELLRATSLLHRALETEELSTGEKSHALFLLGLTYSKLPLFFVNELSELYLQQCIRESPGSRDAQAAYNLYKDIVTLGYTGSSGTKLPNDVVESFKELRELAYGKH